jgi:hypothetical protein
MIQFVNTVGSHVMVNVVEENYKIMSKNRKNKGREYGKKFKADRIKRAMYKVHSGQGDDSDFDIVFEQHRKMLK